MAFKKLPATGRLLPTGSCWCGCGSETPVGSFFAQGHDKFAEGAVIRMKYGSVASFVATHGFGPDGENLREALESWEGSGTL